MKNSSYVYLGGAFWWCFSLCMVGLSAHIGYAQNTPYIDRAPTGEENVRMTQRGPQKIPIEKDVPLEELIQRLESNWTLVDTGKAYYIGYTDDMFSIAAHKDAAIEPLLQFIQGTASSHAKHGAIWTLHLIGIDSKIAGRFYEEFTNPKAREALLMLLRDEDLREHVMSLLVGDPWPSDVPTIMNLLKHCVRHYAHLVKGLLVYPFTEKPFIPPIDNTIMHLDVVMIAPEGSSKTLFLGELEHVSFDAPPQGLEREEFIIQRASPHTQSMSRFWQWSPASQFPSMFSSERYGTDIKAHLQHLLNSGVSSPTYFLEGSTMYLCPPSIARQRWLDWYEKQLAQGGPQFQERRRQQ